MQKTPTLSPVTQAMAMTNHPTLTVNADLVGIILAGGKSTRMGRDKAGLLIHGESLLQRSCNTLLAAGCKEVLLSGHPRADWRGPIIGDLSPHAGPAGGIATSIMWAHSNAFDNAILMFVPVDTPLLTPSLLVRLAESACRSSGCVIENHPLPMAIKVTQAAISLARLIHAEIASGIQWSVKRIAEQLATSALCFSDDLQRQLININTPQQWEELLRECQDCA